MNIAQLHEQAIKSQIRVLIEKLKYDFEEFENVDLIDLTIKFDFNENEYIFDLKYNVL